MTILILLVLAALAVWGVVAALASVASDGYGLPESPDRLRHIQNQPTRVA